MILGLFRVGVSGDVLFYLIFHVANTTRTASTTIQDATVVLLHVDTIATTCEN